MRAFTDGRTQSTADELWLVEHPSVYTQGQAGKPEHVVHLGGIPLVQADRGGQVTYHGPGQMVAYPLLDLRRLGLGVRELVSLLETSVIQALAHWQIEAVSNAHAPGVYVEDKKIASLGLRVRRGCSYHGLSVNVDMDLTPFLGINPCGYSNLEMTQVANCVDPAPTLSAFSEVWVTQFLQTLGLSATL